jgi:Ala-tRNA(Pro) deacylase
MSLKQTIREFLEQKQVSYATLVHQPAYTAQEEAAVAHVPGGDWAKTVICFADDEPVMAVLPAPLVVNLERLRALAGAERIRLASEPEMSQLYPDCDVGAAPPLGPLYKQRVFVDERLACESAIVFSGGTHTDAIRMPYAAFASLAHPVVGDFSAMPGTEKSSVQGGRALWT